MIGIHFYAMQDLALHTSINSLLLTYNSHQIKLDSALKMKWRSDMLIIIIKKMSWGLSWAV